jgi:multidrug efflux system membrane fusion protein
MRAWTTGRKSRLAIYAAAGFAAVVLIAGVTIWRHGKPTQASAPPPVPVTVAEAVQRDVPVYYDALGTVQAINTVAIRAQVNGQLVSIDFRQGQEVRQGDVLAKIDPERLRRKPTIKPNW